MNPTATLPAPYLPSSPSPRWSRRLAVVLLTLGMATTAVHAAVPPDVAEAVVQESGLAGQIAQMPRAFEAGIEQGAAASNLPPEIRAALQRAAATSFDPAKLQASVVRSLTRSLDEAAVAETRQWMRSPQGQRVAALEQAATARAAADQNQALAAGNAAYAAASPQRQSLLAALEQATRASEQAADIGARSAMAMVEGLASLSPREAAEGLKAAREQIEQMRPQMVAAMRGNMLALFASTYAPLDDRELAAYIEQLRSPAGRHTSDALVSALADALDEATRSMARELPRIMRTGGR